jgi:hypothetical protein
MGIFLWFAIMATVCSSPLLKTELMMKPITTLCITLLLLLSPIAQAHKIKTAFTIVLFNERTGFLEVVHRFYLHDSEEAVWELFDKNADIIANESTQATFTNYVIDKFAIKDQNKKQVDLTTLGYQNEGGYFWIYQEAPLQKDWTKLSIKQDALKDIWSDQFNVVNIEGLKQIYTLNFSDSDEWLEINVSLPEQLN